MEDLCPSGELLANQHLNYESVAYPTVPEPKVMMSCDVMKTHDIMSGFSGKEGARDGAEHV